MRLERMGVMGVLIILGMQPSAEASMPAEDHGRLGVHLALSEQTKADLRAGRIRSASAQGTAGTIPLTIEMDLTGNRARGLEIVLHPIDASVEAKPGSSYTLSQYVSPVASSTFVNAKVIRTEWKHSPLNGQNSDRFLSIPLLMRASGRLGAGLEVRVYLIDAEVEAGKPSTPSLFGGEASIAFVVGADGKVSPRSGSGDILEAHFQRITREESEARRQLVLKETEGDLPLPFDPSKFSRETSRSTDLPGDGQAGL